MHGVIDAHLNKKMILSRQDHFFIVIPANAGIQQYIFYTFFCGECWTPIVIGATEFI